MDFGFGGLVDKYEEYFGKRITKLILVLLGLALVGGCITIIWSSVIAPLLGFLDTPLWGQTLAGIGLKALGIGAGVALGFGVTSDLVRWRRTRQLKNLLKEMQAKSDELLQQTREGLARTKEQLDKTAETNAQSRALMELARVSAIAYVEMNKELSDEDRGRALHRIELQAQAIERVPRATDAMKARQKDGKPNRASRRSPGKKDSH